MQTRSIGVTRLSAKATRAVDEIIDQIKHEFGDRFEIEIEDDIIHITGDLHPHQWARGLPEWDKFPTPIQTLAPSPAIPTIHHSQRPLCAR